MLANKDLTIYRLHNMRTMKDGVRSLLAGDFKRGWEQYKVRNHIHWFDRRFDMPYWDGGDIKGKRLLVMYEQGLGEQIYFSSAIPELVAKGIEVLLEVDERLVAIMQRSFPEVTVIPYTFPPHEACYTADYQVFIGTAFGYCRPSFDSFPNKRGYLKADETIARDIYPSDIGLSWFSNAQHYARAKNIPFYMWLPLVNNGKKSVISVQYGWFDNAGITVPQFDITQNLDNCAALLTRCSTIVTVSNTTAHLAAALGVDTHVLVPNAIGRHFYWFPERETVPNYPTASAYLQMPAGNWGPLVDYITKKVLDK